MLKNSPVDNDIQEQFQKAWQSVFRLFDNNFSVWVLRDFHSPNLIWLPERKGHRRVGLIDTQDCVLGHPAYDLVSMLQDARVDLPDGSEERLLQQYFQDRLNLDKNFDQKAFEAAYAGLGAQRATKVLGIFARLFVRDHKPAYLKHLPRVSKYLQQNLQHPALKELADWFDQYLPESERIYHGANP